MANEPVASRLRQAGELTLVSAVTAMALRAVSPIAAPYMWMVPAVAAAAAAVVLILADQVAAAWKDRR